MPRTICTTVYTFDELSDRAKARARDWYREGQDFSDYADTMFDDFVECAEILGITFTPRGVKLMNGTTRFEPDISWSGFSSQGDGASYAGSYRYAYMAPARIRHHAPSDPELHRIADALMAVQRPAFYGLTATSTTGRSRYSHSGTMDVEVEHATSRDVSLAAIEEVTQLLRDFADWMYRQLEKEYEYQTSDEAVDDSIRANEYTFTDDGTREG